MLRAHVLELCLRLRDVPALRHARLVTVARDLERLLVSGHGALEQAEIQVRDAQLKVALREGRLLREQHRGQIAGARPRRLAIGFDGAADATPHIELPEGGEAHAVLGAHGAAGGRGAPRGAGAAAGGGRIAAAGRGDIGGNGRKVAGASRAEERGRLLVPGRREQHVLIGDLHLPLQSVEVGVAVELPPLAARRQLLRLGRLPVLALLVGRRHLQARAMVGGPDRQVPAAAGGAEREQCRDAAKRAPHATPSSGFGKRCRRDLAHSRKRSRYRYITGVV